MGTPVPGVPWRCSELLCAQLLQGLAGWRAAGCSAVEKKQKDLFLLLC